MTIFSYIIPLNENINHQTIKNEYSKGKSLENNLEKNKNFIYQESWLLKLECLQCPERFERWSKKLIEKNHSVVENKNGKDVKLLWVKKTDVDVVQIKEAENQNCEREKMKEWMSERMEDNEWLREWMDDVVG
ncbi:1232_t:CDS:2 [Funneliformis caledonium]|uniref:1232_t:CDS:1 n=1 Tax=Funneliformis caledonium TaxID=1117310 RepID=A0A9N9AX93_9GLOM|nr:1232_t:CDS:2 [Funneliformis caledonium]